MKRTLLLFLVALATTSAALGAEASAKTANFVAPATLNLPSLLPPPPAAGSPTARVELDQILALQSARTPEQAARCVQVENETLWLFGSEVVGPWFTEANLPRTAAFFTRVREDFIAVNRAAKALHPRQRPPFADERIKPCVEFADTGSYPSGHGIQSSMWALLLGEILPAHANGFLLRAATTRNYKAISGVHYPSDLAAGQAVGEALARALLKNADVQQAITELRTEAIAASAPPAAASPKPPERPRLSSTSLSRPVVLGKKAGQSIGLTGMNARWADYGEYLQQVVERIQQQWYAMLVNSKDQPPRGSHVTVTFRLNAKGETEMLKVDDAGGGKHAVFACQNAITYSQPYPAWTKAMIAALGESQELTFSFHYQ